MLKLAPESLKPVAYTVPREYAFETETIASGATKTISLVPLFRPQPGTGIPGHPETAIMLDFHVERAFKPDRLSVAADIASHFRIMRMFIGNMLAFEINEQGVDATIFAEDKPRPEIDWRTIQPRTVVIADVKNVSKRSRVWKARFVGKEVAE